MACLTGGFAGAPKTKSLHGDTAKPRNVARGTASVYFTLHQA